MNGKAQRIHELLDETLTWLDCLNVGRSVKGKAGGQYVGKADGKPAIAQQLN